VVPYQNYQLLEAERCKTLADLRAADVQRGEFAAAISRSFAAIGDQLRGIVIPHKGAGLDRSRTRA
jgi:hypothetical protein